MVWYKAWLDTRWRFLIGLVLIPVMAGAVAGLYPQALARLQNSPPLATFRPFPGYVWWLWFSQDFSALVPIVAALLGSGAALSTSGRGLLFSLALPVPRSSWIRARAALGLAELFALCLLPALVIVLTAPLLGERFGLADAVVYATSAFVAASIFFGAASLLSTVFSDVWRPLLLTLALALAIWWAKLGFYDVMSAADYFRGESFPWLGLVACAALTTALLYAAVLNGERRDF